MRVNKSKIGFLIIVILIQIDNIKAKDFIEKSTDNTGFTYALTKRNISSGGGVVTGGVYTVTSSLAQIDAGHNAIGGDYQFKGGFLNQSNDDLIFKNSFD